MTGVWVGAQEHLFCEVPFDPGMTKTNVLYSEHYLLNYFTVSWLTKTNVWKNKNRPDGRFFI